MEQDSAALQQEKERLESEAAELAMRLDAVMRDKFAHSPTGFDADTPIDKTLNLLHGIIAVSIARLSLIPLYSHALAPPLSCCAQPSCHVLPDIFP